MLTHKSILITFTNYPFVDKRFVILVLFTLRKVKVDFTVSNRR